MSLIADTAFAFQDIMEGLDGKLSHGDVIFEIRVREDWANLFLPRDLDIGNI